MTTPEPIVTTVSEARGWKQAGAADVLDTIANLSNDEVFTPPKLARQVLDLLPAHVWKDSSLRFLDPCCKTGVFLREITKRLMFGLREEFPCEKERREHILRNQVYGIAITELTALMSRRTVYCSSHANREKNEDFPENCYSVVKFDDEDGNIVFHDANGNLVQHVWKKNGKCEKCDAPKSQFDRPDRESHAYPFIHKTTEEIWGKDMKFDVIIGNPPYQISDGGHGASASPIYQKFVERAKEMDPKYLSMIIPARWYAGGKGLDEFRDQMINDRRIRHLTDFPKLFDCFPGVEIKGGVCFFVREANDGDCSVRTMIDGEVISSEVRDLREGGDVLIRENRAMPIFRKVMGNFENGALSKIVSSRKPFGFATNVMGHEKFSDDDLVFIRRGGRSFMPRSEVTVHPEWIDEWKVLTPRAADGHGRIPAPITGEPIIADPGMICSETYLVVGPVEGQDEAENLGTFLQSRFARFMVSLRKNTQDLNKDRFDFVPMMDFSETWTDEKLYTHFGLIQDEIDFIEATIKEMP